MGQTTMDGTEQVVFESTEIGEYSGYIFLDAMGSGDTITVRVYVKDPEEDEYKAWLVDEFSGTLTCPALRLEPMMSYNGVKVTLQQTAGEYRTVTHLWFKR